MVLCQLQRGTCLFLHNLVVLTTTVFSFLKDSIGYVSAVSVTNVEWKFQAMFLWKTIMPLMFPVIIVFICIRIDRFLLFEILSKDICCES